MCSVDGYENRKMFYVTSLLCDSESKSRAVWGLICEKSISVIVLTDFNQGSIFKTRKITFVIKFYILFAKSLSNVQFLTDPTDCR